ncbi:phosphatidylglycerophosphatase A [Pseudobdellovibrio sp. HCB154]|uniref:phosphatidylglycerophosphatase A family protein n=1 Tax=Pseudobdellovibrio sp. HCB154 TaxID=3386277 RepID=UPI0039173427
MNQKLVIQLATFFGAGRLPKSPGTWGTLATIPLWYLLAQLHAIPYMVVVLLLCIAAILIAQAYENFTHTHDSKEIVIDEVVGFLITMTWLPMTWQSLVAGFVLFRIVDIVKPPPIRQLDQKVKGGVGVVIDDIAAGIVCNIILQMVYTYTPWLGAQTQTL